LNAAILLKASFRRALIGENRGDAPCKPLVSRLF